MNYLRRFILFVSMGLALMLVGCGNVVTVPKDPYDGLLPTGVVPPEGKFTGPLTDTRNKRAALIVSGNFERYVSEWVEFHERGGAQAKQSELETKALLFSAVLTIINPVAGASALAGTQGLDEKIKINQEENKKATDPRRVSDRIYDILKSSFSEVKVVSDFGAAKSGGFDYLVLIDLHHTFNGWGDVVHFTGGLHLHDRDVRRIFSINAKHDADRADSDLSAAIAMNNGLNAILGQFERGLAENIK